MEKIIESMENIRSHNVLDFRTCKCIYSADGLWLYIRVKKLG